MEILSWLTSAVALGINAHAVAALVIGIRARDAPIVARYARRCAWSAACFAGLMGIGLAASFLTNDAYQGDSPTERASRLAMLISEVINTTAFAVLVSLLPLIAAAVLHLRALRARARR